MEISCSWPFAVYNDLQSGIESVLVKSINLRDDEVRTPLRSIGFKDKDSEPTMLQSKGSVSFKAIETERLFSVESASSEEMDSQSPKSDSPKEKSKRLQILDPCNPNHVAAIKLQKVYKSFRTRRKLADCAVLIEQSWWKLLDFAELKRSSISFFDIEKHETAISRWSRARTRAAKVGKGLSKNSKARKLALQHWLEAIDPRHRYGHNLHFYYGKWLDCQCNEPFFYWLDIGEGRDVNLVDKCPRPKLQQQCIKYLGPMERKAYEVIVEDGKLLYKQSGEFLDTTEPKGAKWIFVLSTSMILYVGQKRKGTFQHSSFLAGGATSAAGRIVAEKGILKAVWPHSGHYRPTPENFQDFISFLRGKNVDLTDVKLDSVDEEEEESLSKQNSLFLRSVSSEEDLTEKEKLETEQMDAEEEMSDKTKSTEEDKDAVDTSEPSRPSSSGILRGQLTNLSIPDKDDLVERLKFENQAVESSLDGYETAEEPSTSDQNEIAPEEDLSDVEEDEEETIPEETILKRINSHKGLNSYQLGKHLSCKWTTGAGPRIGCMRDYPSKLQYHALEQLKLSPRPAARHFRSHSTREIIPDSFSREIRIKRTSFSGELPRIRHYTPQSSPLRKGAPAIGLTKQSQYP